MKSNPPIFVNTYFKLSTRLNPTIFYIYLYGKLLEIDYFNEIIWGLNIDSCLLCQLW